MNHLDLSASVDRWRPLTEAMSGPVCDIITILSRSASACGGTLGIGRQLRLLGSDKASSRSQAAAKLGRTEDPRAVGALSVALSDRDSGVRLAAAEALVRIGDSRAVEPLLEWAVRWQCEDRAVELISHLLPDAMAVLLNEMMDHDERPIRVLAARVIAQSGGLPHGTKESAASAVLLERWDDIFEAGPAAIDPLRASLRDGGLVAQQAARTLRKLNATDALIDALHEEAGAVEAATALAEHPDPSATTALRQAFEHSSPEIQAAAARALGAMGQTSILLGGIKLKSFEGIRARAALVAGMRGCWTLQFLEVIVAAVRYVPPASQSDYIAAVKEIGRPATARLVALLSDPERSLREFADKSLDGLRWQPETDEERAMVFVQRREWDKATRLGPVASPALILELESFNRSGAAEALGELRERRAVEPLIRLLTTESATIDRVAWAARAEALGRIADPASVRPLYRFVCWDATWQARHVVHALEEIVHHAGPQVSSTDLQAVAKMGDVREIYNLSDDMKPDPAIRLINCSRLRGLAEHALAMQRERNQA